MSRVAIRPRTRLFAAECGCAIALASACARSEDRWFPPPVSSGTVLIAEELHGQLRVFAYAVTATAAIRLKVTGDTSPAIRALTYDDSLSLHGWTSGELENDPTGDPLSPKHIFRLDFAKNGAAAWIEEPALDDALVGYRAPKRKPICDFSGAVTPVATSEIDRPDFLLPLDAARALTGFHGHIYSIDRSGAASSISVSPAAALAVGARDEQGGFWFCAPPAASFWRGRLSGAALVLDPVATSTTFDCPRYMAASVAGSKSELALLQDGGRLDLYDGTFHHIYDFPSSGSSGKGSVLWRDPHRFVAVREGSSQVAFVDDGVLHVEMPVTSLDGCPAATSVPGLGVVVTTVSGALLRYTDAWDTLEGNPNHIRMFAISAYGTGFVYGGAAGNVGQYQQGFCPLVGVDDRSIIFIEPLGPDLVLALDPNSLRTPEPRSPLAILRR